MSNSNNPGFCIINGAIVLYLWEAPTSRKDLKNELLVLQSFLNAYNADTLVRVPYPGTPSTTKAPPPITRILVNAKNHQTSHQSTAAQGPRITALLCTAAGWAATPRERGACVHIFSVNQDPAQGFKEYRIHDGKRSTLTSPSMVAQIPAAQAKNLGTLGVGDLK
ncbi:hypothetical protein AURDEDRAFT_74592 [Auricularia subglabra TFB-10046 SS5]|nr:hypothetical protein AURDEDRAFT_74592 [Auricularia subglabra TFB-10046 SS5]